jgi:peptidoglycan/LPS O-acetylase OafA/YrhL
MQSSEFFPGTGAFRCWIVLISTILISFGGILLALVCIYSLPDRTTRPFIGSFFYLVSAIILIFYFLMQWKKEKAIEKKLLQEEKFQDAIIIVRETLSDKFLKWIITIFAIFFTFLSIGISLICIFALPDETVQPQAGALYLMSGLLVIGVLAFAALKNWSSARRFVEHGETQQKPLNRSTRGAMNRHAR